MIYENGTLLAESRRFADAPQLAVADVDLERLLADRMRQNTFGAVDAPARRPRRFRTVDFARCRSPKGKLSLQRKIESASRTCPATRARATRAARRSTASRCRGWPRACAPPAPSGW